MSTTVEVPPGLFSVLQRASISGVITSVLVIVVIRLIARAFYRAYFHPLCQFPGPKINAATRIPYLIAAFKGNLVPFAGNLHRQYGDIVRIAPDELSIIDPQAWKDVHGHGSKGSAGSMPRKHWHRYGKPVNHVRNLITCKDDDKHMRMRRIFLPAFSDRALRQQEPLFMKYVNILVKKLYGGIEEDPNRKWDMVRMYNFTTFDIMGDITFGEPLHMLEGGEYDPWVSMIFASVKFGSRIGIINWYPLLYKIFKALVPESFAKKRYEHFQHSVQRVTKRLEKGRDSEGVDLWDLVLKQPEGQGLSRGEMDSNSSLFMVAGTETTATLVSGLTYLLLKNTAAMKKLNEEIRSTFANAEDMHMDSIAALPYLNACIKEALRLYPPVPVGLPRLTPPEGSTVCGVFIPPGTTITVPHKVMYTSEKNFKDPQSFIPERWTGEDARFANDNQFALQPFSYGPRDCLGKNMAYHEMRLIVAKVFYNFDLELCPESEGWTEQHTYTLWEKHPLVLKLKPANSEGMGSKE
ncbi:cytochrome P450 monooxygenase-like protein [Lindgomyces ingoldianus]|uniref:Cytochrome P450 monooxygenase-like protein n=1 Tax=Lindgomyces ingoldianus TaxID=673940 RepID=A0ACB6QCS9_9PLEO|nr:cytochrome P450 monooxygenase-like protein [Lindgomyces ingoldianus]KAF2464711.1 cytochrome P450 monooxygenase-like protein [Lindgomyces ingoldianus]